MECIGIRYGGAHDLHRCSLRRHRLRRGRGAPSAVRAPGHRDRHRGGPLLRRAEARGAPAAPARARGQGRRRVHRAEPHGPRRRIPGPAPRSVRGAGRAAARRHGRDRRRGGPPARVRRSVGSVLRLRPRRHVALRAARAARGPERPQAAREPARRHPDRRPWLLPHGIAARAGTRAGGGTGVSPGHRDRVRVRDLGRGQGPETSPARCRDDGGDVPVRRRRRAPAHPGDRTGAGMGGR